jgi:hypothetical protein
MKRRLIYSLAVFACISVNSHLTFAFTRGDGVIKKTSIYTEREPAIPASSETWSQIDSITQRSSAVQVSTLDKATLGLGLGMDYGGVGANFLIYPNKSIGLFGGVGYAIAGAGFNAGLKYRFLPKKQKASLVPYVLAMYGYNAAVAVSNMSDLNKIYYGPTLGIGIDLRASLKKKNYWTFALLIPIRDPAVNDYIDNLEDNMGVDFTSKLIPIGISIGYRIILN